MAVTFENSYVIFSKEQAQHINKRHVDLNKEHRASKFLSGFNLASTLAFLTWKTFKDNASYQIIEEGYKRSHGYFYIYVFKMKKVVGICPWGYPTDTFASTFHGKNHMARSSRLFCISIFRCLLLIREAQKKWNGTLLVSTDSFRSLLVSTNGSFRGHQFYESEWWTTILLEHVETCI